MRASCLLALAVVLSTCSSQTSVLLLVDGDLSPGVEVEALSVSLSQGSRPLWVGSVTLDRSDELPAATSIRLGGRVEGDFELRVAALRGGEEIVVALRPGQLRPGGEVTERVCLHRSCITTPDGPGCAEGRCDGDGADGDGDADADADADGGDGGEDADTCVPAPELCNGLDDDCDPTTADGASDPAVGVPCDGDDADGCEEGVTVCSGALVVCDDVTDDSVETCNGLDDDCDGEIDETGGCPCAQSLSGGRSYLLCDDELGWLAARDFCLAEGYDLVALESAEENDLVSAAAAEAWPTSSFWIGLSDRLEEGTFRWIATGEEAIWTSWDEGQPDDARESEDCGHGNHRGNFGLWNDAPCEQLRGFACEAG